MVEIGQNNFRSLFQTPRNTNWTSLKAESPSPVPPVQIFESYSQGDQFELPDRLLPHLERALYTGSMSPEQVALENIRLSLPTAEAVTDSTLKTIQELPIQYVDGKKSSASVLVIDHFKEQEDISHGDAVSQVLKRNGRLQDSDIQRVHGGAFAGFASTTLLSPGPDCAKERLEKYIELTGVECLMNTNKVLADVLQDPESQIRTINQSQGRSPLTTLSLLSSWVFNDDDPTGKLTSSGEQILKGLGLGPERNIQFLEKAIALIDQVHSTSPLLKAEKIRHTALSKQLADRGVAYVVSAGNDAEELAGYQGLPLQNPLPDHFAEDLFSNPHNIVVGASDEKGTASRTDDSLASFSTPQSEVDYLAKGVDIPIIDKGNVLFMDGTSFSAPLVAGRLAKLRQEEPEAPLMTLQQRLKAAATSVQGSDLPVVL